MGIKQEHWMGMGYYQLCMVGRYWSCWYFNIGGTFIIPSKMENGYQPFCRSNDNICRFSGIGVWGLSKNIGWAWDITNFVWWVGIGHAGTLISAVLLLFRQKWRMAINRSAEAMTIFAVFSGRVISYHSHGAPLERILGFTYSKSIWVIMGKL